MRVTRTQLEALPTQPEGSSLLSLVTRANAGSHLLTLGLLSHHLLDRVLAVVPGHGPLYQETVLTLAIQEEEYVWGSVATTRGDGAHPLRVSTRSPRLNLIWIPVHRFAEAQGAMSSSICASIAVHGLTQNPTWAQIKK